MKNTSKFSIYLSPPTLAGNETEYIQKAILNNHFASFGEATDAFESQILKFTGSSNVSLCASGTSAIHLALKVINVQAGDVILCSSLTFIGASYPIMYENCEPVFIDSEIDTWNVDPVILEFAIKDLIQNGRPPKAFILVHALGMPAQIDKIIVLCKLYNIILIEDAADALGSSFDGKKLGTLGEIGIFSFNANKIISTGGGGAIVSTKKEYIEMAIKYASQSRENVTHYEHKVIGYNYRLSNLNAAIGWAQMEQLESKIKHRREVFGFYCKELEKEMSFQIELNHSFSNRWLSSFMFKGNESKKILLKLEENGIEARPMWKPMHLQPYFKNAIFYGENISENIFQKGISLPSNLRLEEQKKVIAIINKV